MSQEPQEPGFIAEQEDDVRRLLAAAKAARRAPMPGPALPPPGEAVVVDPFRIVVASDLAAGTLSGATLPTAMMRIFAHLFGAGDPVNLVLATPHDPTEADLAEAQRILGEVDAEGPYAGMSLESFAEVTDEPMLTCVVPTGDAAALIHDLTEAMITLELLVDVLADPRRFQTALLLAQRQHELGASRRLAQLLARYCEVPFPS